MLEVNQKLNDNWGMAKCYEKIIISKHRRDGAEIKNEDLFKNFDQAIELFAMENS